MAGRVRGGGAAPVAHALPLFLRPHVAQAEEIRDAFARHGVRYLFGKSGAILLGHPDTTQDADLFLEKSPANGSGAARALRDLGFALTGEQHHPQ